MEGPERLLGCSGPLGFTRALSAFGPWRYGFEFLCVSRGRLCPWLGDPYDRPRQIYMKKIQQNNNIQTCYQIKNCVFIAF
jgi:hypothetical protein